MEEILHSIRDIIAEKAEPGAPAHVDDEVLELTQVVKPTEPSGVDVLQDIDAALEEETTPESVPAPSVATAPPPAPAPMPAPAPEPVAEEPVEAIVEEEPVAEEILEPAPKPAPKIAAKPSHKDHLVSDEPAEEASAALKSLLKNIPKPQVQSKFFRSGETVEDLVIEALKPMLSAWLDENLPILVRELVQKEIEKLVPHETRD